MLRHTQQVEVERERERDGDDGASYGVRSLGSSEWYDRSEVLPELGGVSAVQTTGPAAVPAPPKDPAADAHTPETSEGDPPSEGSTTPQSPGLDSPDLPLLPSAPNVDPEPLATSYDWPPSIHIRGRPALPAGLSPEQQAHDPALSSGTSNISSVPGSISSISRTVSPADSDLEYELSDEPSGSGSGSGTGSGAGSAPASPTGMSSVPALRDPLSAYTGRRVRRGAGGRARLSSSGTGLGRLDPQAPPPERESSYVFSRTHWAVREARERMEEQGGDVSLVLPTLVLPDSSLLGGSRISEHGAQVDQGGPQRERRFEPGRTLAAVRPLHILLTGTNRTANAFLKALDADPRVRAYKVKPSVSGTQGRIRSMRRSGEGAYDVAIMRAAGSAEEGADAIVSEAGFSGAEAPPRETLDLLARVRVVAKGQEGNLERAVSEIESAHTRLNGLLATSASMRSIFDADQGTKDLRRLIQGWARSNGDGDAPWYDLAVLTGDARFLAGRDRDLVNHLKHLVPTLCYPAALSARLAAHIEEPFFSLQDHIGPDPSRRAFIDAAGSIGGPTPRCGQDDTMTSYFAAMYENGDEPGCTISALVDHLITATDHAARPAHLKREDAAITAFMRWKEVQDDMPMYGPTTSSLESSATAPMPTLARLGGNTDWESQLSRRHAARAERRPSARATASAGPLALSLQQNVQTPTGFFGEGAWRSQADVRGTQSVSVVRKAFLDPLDRMRAAVSKVPRALSKTGWTMAIACVAAVVGLGCWWRMQAA